MFSCKRCKCNLKESHRYCYGCGSYIGEPAVKADDWQELYSSEEEQIQYEYNEEGKIIRHYCGNCDVIVEKYYKYCSNCGKKLENNVRIELIEPKTLAESSMEPVLEEAENVGEYDKKIRGFINKFFTNNKLVVAASLLLVFIMAGVYFGRAYFKPIPKYEGDACNKSFVKDKEWIFYSYFIDTPVEGLQEKRGFYKIKADGSNMTKISHITGNYINIYKNYIYYINLEDEKIYRMKKDGSDNKKISDEKATSLIVDKGYIYYRDKSEKIEWTSIFRMELDGTEKKKLSSDALAYNILGDYIYYSSRTSPGVVYRITTEGLGKTKMCKINGVLKYVKDDYIYYSTANENVTDAAEIKYNFACLNKVKIDGTNPTTLASISSDSFFIDKDNYIYYEQYDSEDMDSNMNLYKINSDGKEKAKIAQKISSLFYIANNQVYYIDYENFLPYRKDFKDGKKISLLGTDEKLEDIYNKVNCLFSKNCKN